MPSSHGTLCGEQRLLWEAEAGGARRGSEGRVHNGASTGGGGGQGETGNTIFTKKKQKITTTAKTENEKKNEMFGRW